MAQPTTTQSNNGHQPNPEVVAKPSRRSFTAQYKLKILREADTCTQPGQIGALLRREGLYSSHLAQWRTQRRQGEIAALIDNHRGRPTTDPLLVENDRLRQENQRLVKRLQQTETILEVQKKSPCCWNYPSIPATLERAYQAHPERFVRGLPVAAEIPSAVWINPPATTKEEATH